jgi:hypothetical protein
MTDWGRPSAPSLPGPDRETVPGNAPGALPPIAFRAPRPAGPIAAVGIGFAMGRQRLARRPTLLAVLLGLALVVAASVIERRAGSAGVVERVLSGTFRLVIPLVCFGIAAEASGRGNLAAAVWSAARYGVARRDVALGVVGAALAAAAVLGAFFAAASVALGHSPTDPPIVGDLLTSGWIGALAAAAYTAWFLAGATFGRRGGGRWAPLVADLLLGGSSGLLGAILPRGHARNLLGGMAPMGLSQASSSALLGIGVVVLAIAAALRCRE